MECNRCLFDSSIPAISFDQDGLCNYCSQYDDMEKTYVTGEKGWAILKEEARRLKEEGKGKPYDVVIGVSGGCDSSYMLHLAKVELDLRPLAAHFDNTWNSKIAVENITTLTEKLNIDLYTHVADSHEYNDIFKSMLKASVPESDAVADLSLATVHYMAASKYGVKTIWEGHSFRTEGITPPGWVYMDARYIESIQNQFGTYPVKTVPLLYLTKWFKWMLWDKIKKFRPLYYLDYDKEQTKKFLAETYGWQWYGGHHMENRTAYFANNYYLPVKFNINLRQIEFSGLIRSGQLKKADAKERMKQPTVFDQSILEELYTRLNLTKEEWQLILNLPPKNYREYPTYKPLFIWLRPFFWTLYKSGYVTRSFYDKFTRKD